MKKISTDMNFIYKIFAPIIWLCSWTMAIVIFMVYHPDINIQKILISIVFFLGGSHLIWYLYKLPKIEVYDLGNGLLVKINHQQVQIPDSNIQKISIYALSNPATMIVYFKEPNELGEKFEFLVYKNVGFYINKNNPVKQLLRRTQTSQP